MYGTTPVLHVTLWDYYAWMVDVLFEQVVRFNAGVPEAINLRSFVGLRGSSTPEVEVAIQELAAAVRNDGQSSLLGGSDQRLSGSIHSYTREYSHLMGITTTFFRGYALICLVLCACTSEIVPITTLEGHCEAVLTPPVPGRSSLARYFAPDSIRSDFVAWYDGWLVAEIATSFLDSADP